MYTKYLPGTLSVLDGLLGLYKGEEEAWLRDLEGRFNQTRESCYEEIKPSVSGVVLPLPRSLSSEAVEEEVAATKRAEKKKAQKIKRQTASEEIAACKQG